MKLSEQMAEKFARYNKLLEQIERDFEHIEPAWNPEGGWYPEDLKSNDSYRPEKNRNNCDYNSFSFWNKHTFLEVYYQDGDAFLTVSFDHKDWTNDQIHQQTDNPLLAYYKPILGPDEMEYLLDELNFYWGSGSEEKTDEEMMKAADALYDALDTPEIHDALDNMDYRDGTEDEEDDDDEFFEKLKNIE